MGKTIIFKAIGFLRRSKNCRHIMDRVLGESELVSTIRKSEHFLAYRDSNSDPSIIYTGGNVETLQYCTSTLRYLCRLRYSIRQRNNFTNSNLGRSVELTAAGPLQHSFRRDLGLSKTFA
jgi:hypothetical protein